MSTNVRPVTAARRLLCAPKRSRRGRLSLLLLAVILISAALLAACSPAGAVLSGEYGMQRRAAPTVKAEPLQYHGGPVLHSSDAYTIYWDPTESYRGEWQEQINGYMQNVGADRTSGDVFALNGQYRDGVGAAANVSTFRGAYTDKTPYPSSGCTEAAALACLTDAQIRTELQRVIGSGALPGATGPGVYYVLTPPGVTVCTDEGGHGNCSDSTSTPANGICGYHSAIDAGGPNQVIYAVQPWIAGNAGFVESEEPLKTYGPTEAVLACQGRKNTLFEPNQLGETPNLLGDYATALPDVIINDLSVEQSNIAVDPLLDGWYQTATKDEQGDMCQSNFGPPPQPEPTPDKLTHAATYSNEAINGHPYYVQWAFDSTWLTTGRGYYCWQGDNLTPHYTAPNPVNVGDVVGFDGTESLVTLQAATSGLPADEPYLPPVYSWSFGDGASVSGANDVSVFHTYRYGGEYTATLTITDSGGSTASYSQAITVVGPPPPPPPGGGGGSGSSTSSPSATSTTTGAGTGSGSGSAAPKVVATQAVASHSLAAALKGGLVVRYSVNEQATGRFEVLLANSVARRIGLRGTPATGLAAGTPAQTVIAKAILVTTRGGGSTYNIKFSKATAAKLRKLRQVTLMIRLLVHNAKSPTVTTVLNTVNLR